MCTQDPFWKLCNGDAEFQSASDYAGFFAAAMKLQAGFPSGSLAGWLAMMFSKYLGVFLDDEWKEILKLRTYIDLYGHPHLIDTGGTPQTVQPDEQDPSADGAMS